MYQSEKLWIALFLLYKCKGCRNTASTLLYLTSFNQRLFFMAAQVGQTAVLGQKNVQPHSLWLDTDKLLGL